jgi:hypothetical protein
MMNIDYISMEYYGIVWDSMDMYGTEWNSWVMLGIVRFSMVFWGSMRVIFHFIVGPCPHRILKQSFSICFPFYSGP